MLDQTLLPPNATAQDKAAETATRIPPDLTGDIGVVGRVADCPEDLLPWLAHAMSVDEWDPDWSADRKRAVIAASVQIHRRKGTIGSVRRAIEAFGFGDAIILEGQQTFVRDGSVLRNGAQTHGYLAQWSEYTVRVSRPITIAQGQQLRAILARVAPARCALKELNFKAVAHLHNNTIRRDGTYTRGAVT